MSDIWTREHPEPPEQEPSDFYWFCFEGDKEADVIEVYVNRKYWPNGWWGPKVNRPKERPPRVKK